MSAGKQNNTPEIDQDLNYGVGGAYAKADQALKTTVPVSGLTGAKPAANSVLIGFRYFATDHVVGGVPGAPIWSDGTAWHDAAGAAVL